MKTNLTISAAVLWGTLLFTTNLAAQDNKYPPLPAMTPDMTEFWSIQPAIITPGDKTTNAYITAPSDAIVLFDGTNLNQWIGSREKGSAPWTIQDGAIVVKGGTGDIQTKADFDNFQLHIEWSAPTPGNEKSQGRGNSGIFLQDRYELQVLDNYQNETYGNGQAGSIYKQTPPLVNAMRKPGEWNTYDVIYTAPTFKEDGTYRTPPCITVLHNGVVVQNNTAIRGTTEYIGHPQVQAHGKAPIRLQDHGNPVKYRNIWIRPL